MGIDAGLPAALSSGSFAFAGLAEDASGGLSAWGAGEDGQLGDGSGDESAAPVGVTGFSGPVAHYEDSASYSYAADGLLASEDAGGLDRSLAWSDATGGPLLAQFGTTDLLYGPGGRAVEELDGGTAPVWVLSDEQGSVRALASASGAVEASYDYGPTGRLAAVGGGSAAAFANPLGYDGACLDLSTGLVSM
ncbi:MAG TPA: RCC1 domain-containing protein, partial [Mycobacteriales bacterium]